MLGPVSANGGRRRTLALVVLCADVAGGAIFGTTGALEDPGNVDSINECFGPQTPDATRCVYLFGVTLCHSEFHLGLSAFQQPFLDEATGIVAAFTGRLYNLEELALYRGAAGNQLLSQLYLTAGAAFPRFLHGEFSAVLFDVPRGRVVLARDGFGTQPLWYSWQGSNFQVASSRGAVARLNAGGGTLQSVPPNTVLTLSMDSLYTAGKQDMTVLSRTSLYEHDTSSFRRGFPDFAHAFSHAVKKRAETASSELFLFRGDLSAAEGIAVGVLQSVLLRFGFEHAVYNVTQQLGRPVVYFRFVDAVGDSNLFETVQEKVLAVEQANSSLADDAFAWALRHARLRGRRVYLSTCGAAAAFEEEDAVIESIRGCLRRDQELAAPLGVEVRYPFLDVLVRQELSWMAGPDVVPEQQSAVGWLRSAAEFAAGRLEPLSMTQSSPSGLLQSSRGSSSSSRMLDDADQSAELLAEEQRLAAWERELLARNDSLQAQRQEAMKQSKALDAREAVLSESKNQNDQQMQQMLQTTLFTLLPRLVRLRSAAEPSDSGPLARTADLPVHERWSNVEVLTCVSVNQPNVADFPVFGIFKATTFLRVHNVCEGQDWGGIDFRLRMYERFLGSNRAEEEARYGAILPVLYYVSDGLDVFFNDMSGASDFQQFSSQGNVSGTGSRLNPAWATARLIAERYEAVARSAPPVAAVARRPIVVSTERLCGWGGAHLCSDEDERTYPDAPTDSKYLNAGGYLGPAAALRRMIQEVLQLKATASSTEAEKGRGSDQYFFMKYFWRHQDEVALDYNQHIFGNFLEIAHRPCERDYTPQCAVKPCCTESDNFRHFPKIFYGRYRVQGCSVWRGNRLPVSWHGNGAGKWLFLLSVNALSQSCPVVANMSLGHFNAEMVEGMLGRVDRWAQPDRGIWLSGFLTSPPQAVGSTATAAAGA